MCFLLLFLLLLLLLLFLISSLLSLYFILEMQWILLIIFFILGSSLWRGCINYIIFNSLLSILFIIGILFSNSLFFILGCFGKVGSFHFVCY